MFSRQRRPNRLAAARRQLLVEELEPRRLLASDLLGWFRTHQPDRLVGNVIQAGTYTIDDDVEMTQNAAIEGDVTLDLTPGVVTAVTGHTFTVGSGYRLSGHVAASGDGRDNLTIKADTVVVRGVVAGAGLKDVTLQAGRIQILDDAVVSTRRLADADESDPANFATKPSIADSGNLVLATAAMVTSGTESIIEIMSQTQAASGPRLLAHVLDTDSGVSPGDVKISAEETRWRLGISPWGGSDKQASITLQDATVRGHTISVSAAAEDENPLNSLPSWASKLIVDPLFEVPQYLINSYILPASVEWRGSESSLTVKDARLIADGNISLTSSSVVDASVEAISTINSAAKYQQVVSHVAIAFSRGTGTAETKILGDTTIQSGDGVTISSSVKNTAAARAVVFGNVNQKFDPADARQAGGSVAVAVTDSTSHAIVDSGVQVVAAGNVKVKAAGDVKSDSTATTAVYLSGTAGLGLSFNYDTTDVLAQVGGHITAGSSTVGTEIRGTNIEPGGSDDDTIRVPGHPFHTGDRLIYSASGSDPISGLDSGQTYTVLVVDQNTIKLARDTAIDIDNQGVNAGVQHSLSPQDGYFIDAASDIDPATDEFIGFSRLDRSGETVHDTAHGFLTGQPVTYFSDDNGSEFAGLTTQGEYYVVVTSPSRFQLASTLDRAMAGVADIDLVTDDVNTGPAHVLNFVQRVGASRDADSVEFSGNRIHFATPHGFYAGQPLLYAYAAGGSPIGGLAKRGYFAILVDDHTIELAETFDDALHGIVRDFRAVSVRRDMTLVKHSDNKIYRYVGPDQALLLSTIGYAHDTNWVDTQDPNPSAFVPDPASNRYLSSFDTTATGGTGTQSFAYADRLNRFDPASSLVNADQDAITIPNHGLETGDTVYYEVDPGYSTSASIPVNLSFDPRDVAEGGDVDYANNTIAVETLGLQVGDPLVYQIGYDGEVATSIRGLAAETKYEVQEIDTTAGTIKLRQVGGSKTIDLRSGATGRLHNLQAARTVKAGDTPLRNLTNQTSYYAVVVDANTIQLAETLAQARDAEALKISATPAPGSGPHLLLDPAEASGIGVTATLGAKDNTKTKGATGNTPRWNDLLANPQLLPLVNGLVRPWDMKDMMKGDKNFGWAFKKMEGKEQPFTVGLGASMNWVQHTVIADVKSGAVLKCLGDLLVSSTVTQNHLTIDDSATTKDSDGLAWATSFGLAFFQNTVDARVYDGAALDAGGRLSVTAKLTYPYVVDFAKTFAFTDNPDTDKNEALEGPGNVVLWLKDATLGGKLLMDKFFNTFVTTKNKGRKLTAKDEAEGKGPAGSYAGTFATALSGVYLQYDNASRAIVGYRPDGDTTMDGVAINQVPAYRGDQQSVLVDALTDMTVTDATGIIHMDFSTDIVGQKLIYQSARTKKLGTPTDAFNLLGSRAKNGVGVAFIAQVLNNTTTARIEDGVVLHTGPSGDALQDEENQRSLAVRARESLLTIHMVQGGGDAETFGLTGSAIGLGQTSTTIAQIASGARVEGGPVLVHADSDNLRVSLVGSWQQTDSVGIGVGVGVNVIDRTTKAIVGQELTDDAPNPGGTAGNPILTSSGDVTIEAENTGTLIVIALAAAINGDPPKLQEAEPDPRQLDINLAGSVAINDIQDIALAYVNDQGTLQITGGALEVSAENTTFVGAFAGGASLDWSTGKRQRETAIGLYGSYALNYVDHTTQAFVSGAGIQAASATLTAIEGSTLVAVTVGLAGSFTTAAGSRSTVNVNVPGALSQCFFDDTAEAFLRNAVLDVTGDLRLKAEDNSQIYTIAGAVGVGISMFGPPSATPSTTITPTVGFSVASNAITNTVRAYLENTAVNPANRLSFGDIELTASEGAEIWSVTAAGSLSWTDSNHAAYAFAGAAAGSGNGVTNIVEAYVNGGSVYLGGAAKRLKLEATDDSNINADSGGFGFAFAWGGEGAEGNVGSLSVGASVSVNTVDSTVRAYIDGASVTTAGPVDLFAASGLALRAAAVGGAVGSSASQSNRGLTGSFQGAGCGADNNLQTTLVAAIRNGSAVGSGTQRPSSVTVQAIDSAAVKADAGGISIGVAWGMNTNAAGVTVGVGAAANDIRNSVTASIDNSTVTAAGDVTVFAQETGNIHALAIAGTIDAAKGQKALALSGAGAGSGNEINSQVTASIVGDEPGADRVDTTGAVTVTTIDNATIKSDAGGVAVAAAFKSEASVAVSVGAALAINRIGQDAATVEFDASNGDIVDVVNDWLVLDGHNLHTGDLVIYSNRGGFSIGGLTNNQQYYVLKVDGQRIQLARPADPVKNPVDLTSLSAAPTPRITFDGSDPGVVLTGSDTIHFLAGHGFATGDRVIYSAGGGKPIDGLTDQHDYYVISLDASNIKLARDQFAAEQYEDATADERQDIVIDLREVGTGTAHRFNAPQDSAQSLTYARHPHAATAALSGVTVDAGGQVAVEAQSAAEAQHKFDAASAGAVDLADDTLFIEDHGLQDGQLVTYSAQGGTPIGGLQDGGTYYVIKVDDDWVQLSRANDPRSAQDLTRLGSGTNPHTLTFTQEAGIDTLALAGSLAVAQGQNGLKGFGAGTFAGFGAGVGSEIDKTLDASIVDGAVVHTGGDFRLTAVDGTRIVADSGAAGVAASFSTPLGKPSGGALAFAVGPSIALSDIADVARATISGLGTVVEACGTVTLTATSTATNNTFALAAALSGDWGSGGSAAGAAAAATNEIANVTTASIAEGAAVRGAGTIALSAADNSQNYADAGGGSLAVAAGSDIGITATIGVSLARNTIRNVTEAFVQQASLAALGADPVDVSITATSNAGCEARSVALVVSIAEGSTAEVSLSGGGADSRNYILTKTNAHLTESDIASAAHVGNLHIAATGTSTIDAKVAALAGSVSVGRGKAAVAATVGAVEARNSIGFDEDGHEIPAEIQAYLFNSDVAIGGDLSLSAEALETIEAGVGAGSVAVSATSGLGIGLGGAGARVHNQIATLVKAFADAEAGQDLSLAADSITITADDCVSISASVGTATVGVAVAGKLVAGTLNIGVSLAHNEVRNEVEAFIRRASSVVTTDGGDIRVSATSRGKELFPLGSGITAAQLDDAATADLDDPDTTVDEARQDLDADVAFLGALRAVFAAQHIHLDETDYDFDAATSDATHRLETLDPGLRIKSPAGPVYEYASETSRTNVDLSVENYGDANQWKQVDDITIQILQEGQRWSLNDRSATYVIAQNDGGLSVYKTTIEAVSVAVAISAAVLYKPDGLLAVAISGAGAEATNVVLTKTNAFVEDSQLISGGDVALDATDTSSVIAWVVSASAAVGLGGKAGVGASIGVAVARNRIGYTLEDQATTYTTDSGEVLLKTGDTVKILHGVRDGDIFQYIGESLTSPVLLSTVDYTVSNAWQQINLSDDTPREVQAYTVDSNIAATGALTLTAMSDATIEACVGSGSMAVSGGKYAGVGLSGVGVSAENHIATRVRALIDGGGASGISAGQIALLAADTSSVDVVAGAGSVAATLAASFEGAASVSVALAVSLARSTIANQIEAFISSADVTATSGSISIEALENADIDATSVAVALGVGVAIAPYGVGVALSGGGAEGTNTINNSIRSYVADSHLTTTGPAVSGTESRDVVVRAQSTSTIHSLAGAATGSISGGLVAAAGAVGVSLARNLIGYDSYRDDSGLGNQVLAYVENSAIESAGDVIVTADSEETAETISFSGSLAIAVGIGGAVAAAGAEATSRFRSRIKSYLLDTTVAAEGDLTVVADSDAQVTRAEAIGVAVSAGAAGLSVGVSVIDNTIADEVTASINSTAPREMTAGGGITVQARTLPSISDVTAVTASVSGAIAIAGGGIDIGNTIDNDVVASVIGAVSLLAGGDVQILSGEQSTLSAEAVGVEVSAAAVGVALVRNQVSSTIQAYLDNDPSATWTSTVPRSVSATADDMSIRAEWATDLKKTRSIGVSASPLVGAQGNEASAKIQPRVEAYAEGAAIHARGDVQVLATADNRAQADADGGALSILAVGAMVTRVRLGRGDDVDEVVASLGNGVQLEATDLRIEARSCDDLLATSIAAAGGAVAAAGAQANVTSDLATLARIGDDAQITVDALTVNSDHAQEFDARSDSYSFAVLQGSGAGVDNVITSKANVAIGSRVVVTADNIYLTARNQLDKEKYKDAETLLSGSAAALNVAVLLSQTDIGQASQPFEAVVDIGSGTRLLAVGNNAQPGSIQIAATNDITAVDDVRVIGVSGYGVSTGKSRIDTHSLAKVHVGQATLENQSGDVIITTRTETGNRAGANLYASGVVTGGGSVAIARTDAENRIELDNATIQGGNVSLQAGRDQLGVSNLLDCFANTEITTLSLAGISVPNPTARVTETNAIELLGAPASTHWRT